MITATIHQSTIKIFYPIGKELPKKFTIKAGRSSGVYHWEYPLDVQVSNPLLYEREVAIHHFLDVVKTGVYYIKVSATGYDDVEVAADEIIINVVEPTEGTVAPIVVIR
ncbi:hypothetical protein HOO68_05830 [Candidatus Gracilibacteria bacterium]|nr:hypothetical protein [Candidatus Gracilibacteria bacterium]